MVIAYYLPEAYSQQVQLLYENTPEPTINSFIEVEVLSVFSRLVRTQELTLDKAREAAALFSAHLEQGLYTQIPLRVAHYRQAREYIARFYLPLKAPDALHLAAAALEQLPLLTADRQLAHNAESLGIAVELLTVS
ncbi:MAG: type II toxin-antitoxin system VapC family toxin [Caldilineaceae bacterium]|nr:type II toxin-antitoxin system VapC family toxin [Caldilineaceae bacterium]